MKSCRCICSHAHPAHSLYDEPKHLRALPKSAARNAGNTKHRNRPSPHLSSPLSPIKPSQARSSLLQESTTISHKLVKQNGRRRQQMAKTTRLSKKIWGVLALAWTRLLARVSGDMGKTEELSTKFSCDNTTIPITSEFDLFGVTVDELKLENRIRNLCHSLFLQICLFCNGYYKVLRVVHLRKSRPLLQIINWISSELGIPDNAQKKKKEPCLSLKYKLTKQNLADPLTISRHESVSNLEDRTIYYLFLRIDVDSKRGKSPLNPENSVFSKYFQRVFIIFSLDLSISIEKLKLAVQLDKYVTGSKQCLFRW